MLALTVPRNACRGRGPNKEQQAAPQWVNKKTQLPEQETGPL